MNNELKQNSFFTKKRIIWFSILFVITIALLSLTIVFVLQIDFNNLFSSIKYGLTITNYQFVFLLLLLLFPFIRTFMSLCFFYFALRREKIKASFYDWLSLSFVLVFIVSITPSAIGSEPYIIYWLNKKTKNLQKSSAIVLASSFIGQSAAMIVTWPSFIYYCSIVNYPSLTEQNLVAFWFLIVGMGMDMIVLSSFVILIFTKRTHYFFSLIFHKVKKTLKLKYKSKEEIRVDTIENESFKKEVMYQLKFKTNVICTFINFVIYNIAYYLMLYFSFALIDGTSNLDFWAIFNYTNIATTANNFIPLPGSEGTLQLVLKILLNNVANNATEVSASSINNAIFIWRFFTTQIPALIGFGFVASNSIIYFANKKRNKNINVIK